MTEDWDPYFNQAVADWNVAPALSLTIEVAKEPDPDCMYIIGKLKACNGEYGKTRWSGLNEAWLDGRGVITASTAKMNESYLKGSQYAEKLFVVCHELGHGYGLPHRDVNPSNIDLGTCLDYTTMYRNNMQPDDVDFMNLENLYGTIGQKRHLREEDILSSSSSSSSVKNHGTSIAKNPKAIPQRRHTRSYKEGRLLFQSKHKEIYEEELTDGGKLITTLFLP